jgi:hypothetical protein
MSPKEIGAAMKNLFQVQLSSFSNLREIDGAWAPEDFAALLDAMEYGDQTGMSAEDLREMCLMSMQDLTPEDAAYLVLKHKIGDALREGQLRNMANEMLNEKLWEEYVDPDFHERLFNVGSLLYAAMPKAFPEPDAVQIMLEVTAVDAGSKQLLTTSLNETFLVRLLADGMDDQAILRRLYGDQLEGKSFPNADEIVWIVRTETVSADTMAIEVIGSGYWLDALNRTKSYSSTAYADELPTSDTAR